MILHIYTSNSIFLKLAINSFSNSKVSSKHIIVGKLNELDQIPEDTIYFQLHSKEYYSFLNSELTSYKLIIFHSLLGTNMNCLKDILRKKIARLPIAWVIYGAEIQDSFILPSKFLGRKTRFLYYYLLPYRIFIPFYRIIHRVLWGSFSNSIKHIDYFAHFMPEEVDFVYNNTNVKKPLLWHSYAMIENFIEPSLLEKHVVKNGNILIGNSASFTSNHIEIFEKINEFDLIGRKIIVPLSYGNKVYGRYIIKKGYKIFGSKFEPLDRFFEKEEYHLMLLGCSVMILNHYRQQALGNIISAVWLGIKVYLHEFTSTFKYLKRLGIYIYSIEKDLSVDNLTVFESLSNEKIEQNRKILTKVFGKENFIQEFNNSYSLFIS